MPLPPSDYIDEWWHRRSGLIDEISRRSLYPGNTWAFALDAAKLPTPSSTGKLAGDVIGEQRLKRKARDDMRERFVALATGATPVVVKVAGFNKGGGAKDLVSYISREGQIKLENERGEVLLGQSAPAQVAHEWTPLMSPRDETKDFASFTMEIAWQSGMPSQPIQIFVAQALGNRAFAYAQKESETGYKISGLVVLNAGSGDRLEPNAKTADLIEVGLRRDLTDPNISISFSFDDYGHGTRWASARLRNLATEFPGGLRDDTGQVIDTREKATKLVQQHWRNLAGTRTPRDMVHLIISVGKDSGYEALERSVRGFLAQEFQGRRYVFAIHDPTQDPKAEQDGGKRPHFHAHAIVTAMTDYGDRLNVWVTDMARWRSTLAEHGRANHLAVVSVQRAEIATARAYTHHQVRPTNFAGRTEHRGTSNFANMRYSEKRIEMPEMSAGEKARASAEEARKVWEDLTHPKYGPEIRQHANRMVYRFMRAEDWLEHRLAEREAKTQKTASVRLTQSHHSTQQVEFRDNSAHRLSLTAVESGNREPDKQAKSGPHRDVNGAGVGHNSPTSAPPLSHLDQKPFAALEEDGKSFRARFTEFYTAFKNAIDAQLNPPSRFELEMARSRARHQLEQSILRSQQIPGMVAIQPLTQTPIQTERDIEHDKLREIAKTVPAPDRVAKTQAETDQKIGRATEQSTLEKSRSFDRDSYER